MHDKKSIKKYLKPVARFLYKAHFTRNLNQIFYMMIIINFISVMVISTGAVNILSVYYTNNTLHFQEFIHCKLNIFYLEMLMICFAFAFFFIIQNTLYIRAGQSTLKLFNKEIDITNLTSFLNSILFVFTLFSAELLIIFLVEKALTYKLIFSVTLSLSQSIYSLFSIQLAWVVYCLFWLSEIALIFFIVRRLFIGIMMWIVTHFFQSFEILDIMLSEKESVMRLNQMDYVIHRIHKCIVANNKENIPMIINNQFQSFLNHSGYFKEVFLLYVIIRFCIIFEFITENKCNIATDENEKYNLINGLEQYLKEEQIKFEQRKNENIHNKDKSLIRLYEMFIDFDKGLPTSFFQYLNYDDFILQKIDDKGFELKKEFYWATFFIHLKNNIRKNNFRVVFHMIDYMFNYQLYVDILNDINIHVYPYRFLFLFNKQIESSFDDILTEIEKNALEFNYPLIEHSAKVLKKYSTTFKPISHFENKRLDNFLKQFVL